MQTSDFKFDIPENLIAQFPLAERSASRLLVLRRGSAGFADSQFSRIADFIQAGDLLVFNNTRVIPARLLGHKDTGGKVEIMLERILDDSRFIGMMKCSKTPRVGQKILFANGKHVTYEGREKDFFVFSYCQGDIHDLFSEQGQMPLPPYIKRSPEETDRERYQTIFAERPGAVAAPTASLHFDEKVMRALHDKGVKTAEITLHVGAGTFQPVRVENLDDHVMHSEYFEIPPEVQEKVRETRQSGKRVFAVGTTSLRALEAASGQGELKSMQGETRLFIRPGYRFRTVDGLITNFHLSESTLLMLVSAFAGYDTIRHAYQHAIDEKYRFFSYGDSMLILPRETDK